MKKVIPAISIIIPMYNVEKYIGECLDSILAQTFTDYEVIVVDDCSTDKSCEVVESYMKKFNKKSEDKLQLLHTKKNSGGAGTPRNIGIKFSRGEYLFFMDSDDIILENALNVFYQNARKFDVDVVHCEKWYTTRDENITKDKNSLILNPAIKMNFVEKPTLLSESPEEKVARFCRSNFWWAPWTSFVSRKFILENEIQFPNLSIADDFIFSFFMMISADKILYLPDVLYVWRTLENSNCREKLSVEKIIHKRVGDVFKGVSLLDEFTSKFTFFNEHPEGKQSIFNFFTDNQIAYVFPIYSQIPAYKFDGLIRRELLEIKDSKAVTAFLFSRMNLLHIQLIQARKSIRQQPPSVNEFQKQQAIIQQQAAQIQQLQSQLNAK